jgi:hypothetical protein
MKKILVSLVSEQTIPNVLGVHYYKPDELLFITTEDMENKNKVSSILKTLNKLGITENEAKLKNYQEESERRKELSNWIVKNYNDLKNLLVWISGNLRGHRDDKEFNFVGKFSGPSKAEIELMRKLEFTV